jgi:hypothetical protein
MILKQYYAEKEKRVPEFRVPVSDPEYPGIYRVIPASYPSRIRSCSIRILHVFAPNIKNTRIRIQKTGICTIRIRYPTGIPDPFSPLRITSFFILVLTN